MKKYISALNLILFAVFITPWCEERDGRTNSNKLKGRSRNYESNSFYQDAEAHALASLSQNCYQNYETYKGIYDEIWNNEQGLRDAADARETQGIWKTVGGVFLVVGGTVCIVASGGAATPIVAAGWTAGGGTIAFGVADSIEGAQDIYYGSIGDIDSTSMNYLKSVVFQGNEDAYYLTENVFAFASSAFIPISQAARVGNLTFRSGVTTVAKERIAMMAGAGASDVTMRVTGNQTASVVAGMIASGATGRGLNGVDTRFNISGNRVKSNNDTITYRRVQGGKGNNASQIRIEVNEDGIITIPNKDANLSISINNGENAEYFWNKRGGDAQIVEVEVPKWFDDFLQENAIPQINYKRNPLNQGGTAPKITDVTTPGKCYELPAHG